MVARILDHAHAQPLVVIPTRDNLEIVTLFTRRRVSQKRKPWIRSDSEKSKGKVKSLA